VDLNINALGDALAPYARQVAGSIPGGAAVVDVVDRYNATNRSTPTNRAPGAVVPPANRNASSAPWYQRPLVIGGAAVAVVGLVLALVFLRRR
jgi:hypothetical protein